MKKIAENQPLFLEEDNIKFIAMQLDLETLQLFEGKISEGGNLYFSGSNENSWCIVYRDFTSIETEDFYKIINPFGDMLIYNMYCFRYIQEAILFFQVKKEDYFRNASIIISGIKSNQFITSYLLRNYIQNKQNIPRLLFFHSLENFDMVALYLELLDKGITYRMVKYNNKNFLKIQYKDIQIEIGFEQISKSRISFLLGINDRKYYIRNHFLSYYIDRQRLAW
ncbi:hypothetical protein HNP38_002554 [Chryseobacterium defluvii]|uniref:Uncharacterized protein n=1 Tax=Chryseobacterium defluvii TaxID=160396 RepID=A0A840KID9_9FLAO|nr:hypothetical protein [Chryseobacterium defluvii]MBB4807250.1 hypothetical protein [Chryseobacterium defluvii]